MPQRVQIGPFVRRHVVSLRALVVIALATVLFVFVGGIVVTLTDGGRFHSLFDGWWWAATTVTTVGYGDVVPVSTAGRLFAMGMMFTGIALVAVLTASIAALLMSEDVEQEERRVESRLDTLEQQLDEVIKLLGKQRPS